MNTVIDKMVSVSERDFMLNFLDQLSQKIFISDINVKNWIISNISHKFQKGIFDYFKDTLKKGNETKASEKIKDLKREIEMVRVVTLCISFEPSDKLFESVSKWFEGENKVFIELKEDRTLIGGMIIESKGFIKDYSLKNYFLRKDNN